MNEALTVLEFQSSVKKSHYIRFISIDSENIKYRSSILTYSIALQNLHYKISRKTIFTIRNSGVSIIVPLCSFQEVIW